VTREEFIASLGETGARMLANGFEAVACDPESCGYIDCKGWRMKFDLNVPRDQVFQRLRAAVGVGPDRLRGRKDQDQCQQ
jgi:hypothetical protein